MLLTVLYNTAMMPWQPAYYRQFLDKGSLVYKRWFPLAYIKEVLALNDPMDVKLDTPLEDVLKKYDDQVAENERIKQEKVAKIGCCV